MNERERSRQEQELKQELEIEQCDHKKGVQGCACESVMPTGCRHLLMVQYVRRSCMANLQIPIGVFIVYVIQ